MTRLVAAFREVVEHVRDVEQRHGLGCGRTFEEHVHVQQRHGLGRIFFFAIDNGVLVRLTV